MDKDKFPADQEKISLPRKVMGAVLGLDAATFRQVTEQDLRDSMERRRLADAELDAFRASQSE